MSIIDLSQFGIARTIALDGEIVDTFVAEGGTPLFLFEENHRCESAIQSCLRMACRLIDDRIVAKVCVEGYPRGEYPDSKLRDIRRRARRQEVNDELIIAEPVRNKEGLVLFATTMCALRPYVEIVGIENMDAYEQAGTSLNNLKKELPSKTVEHLREQLEGRLRKDDPANSFQIPDVSGLVTDVVNGIDKVFNQSVLSLRNEAFIRNIVSQVQPEDATQAAIVNVGREHHDAIVAGVKDRRGYSIIQIRPDGLKEWDEQQSQGPCDQATKRVEDLHDQNR